MKHNVILTNIDPSEDSNRKTYNTRGITSESKKELEGNNEIVKKQEPLKQLCGNPLSLHGVKRNFKYIYSRSGIIS